VVEPQRPGVDPVDERLHPRHAGEREEVHECSTGVGLAHLDDHIPHASIQSDRSDTVVGGNLKRLRVQVIDRTPDLYDRQPRRQSTWNVSL